MNAAAQFRDAMRRAGLDYAGPIHADGKRRRFKAGQDRDNNSWFILFPGPPVSGAFGCWKRGFKDKWCEKEPSDYSDRERQDIRRHWKEADEQCAKAEAERQAKARRVAAWLLSRAQPATDGHGYLKGKGVRAHGLFQSSRGSLVVPLLDASGALHSLQFIDANGAKIFLPGGRVSGCCFTICDKADGPLVVCEGYATGASVHQASGHATICAMNCANLNPVAKALRAKWPEREIIVAGDNDQFTENNPGLTKATEAAKAVGAKLAIPKFADLSNNPTDFNDLHQREGLKTVKKQIKNATVPQETDAEAFDRLAKLTPAEYDRVRKAEAARLKIRPATLDAEVSKRRPQADSRAQGTAVNLANVEPWPELVNGCELLDAVSDRFTHYGALPDGAADAMALWTAGCHVFEAFIHTPRLNLCSPEKGCGKTVILDVIASMTPRPLRTENITPAVLFRLVEANKPVLLLDEVDTYLGDADELRGLLNAGHKRGAMAYRCEGENNEVRGFAVFAPAALAGIGALPGTLHDRSIVIRLTRAKPGEVKAQFDSRHIGLETELCRKLARWAADNFKALEACDPVLPENAFNRVADNWRPLFAIAEVIGGDWPRRAREAFAKLTSNDDADAQGIGATLLTDVRGVFASEGTDRLPSARLAEKLAAIEGRPWHEYGKSQKPITPNQVAKLLRRFNVSPRVVRIGDDTVRGYELADFRDAFERFLPGTPLPKCNGVTEAVNIGDSQLSEVSRQKTVLHPENATLANAGAGCDGVAFQKPEPAEPTAKVRPAPPGWPAGKPADPALAASILGAEAARKEAEAAKAEAMML